MTQTIRNTIATFPPGFVFTLRDFPIEQAMTDYKRLGYSDNWINQRLKSIEIRKDLTDEWKKHGIWLSIILA
jgi:hypothetical protein